MESSIFGKDITMTRVDEFEIDRKWRATKSFESVMAYMNASKFIIPKRRDSVRCPFCGEKLNSLDKKTPDGKWSFFGDTEHLIQLHGVLPSKQFLDDAAVWFSGKKLSLTSIISLKYLINRIWSDAEAAEEILEMFPTTNTRVIQLLTKFCEISSGLENVSYTIGDIYNDAEKEINNINIPILPEDDGGCEKVESEKEKEVVIVENNDNRENVNEEIAETEKEEKQEDKDEEEKSKKPKNKGKSLSSLEPIKKKKVKVKTATD